MLFGRNRNLIGLDVGTSAVKAVELTWHNGPVITGFGYVPLPSPDAVPEAIVRVLRENEFHSRHVVTSVSGKSVIVRYLTMFRMGGEDLRNAVHEWGGATEDVLALVRAHVEQRLADEPDDVWLRPYEQDRAVEQSMQDYLSWEVGLVEQIERDGTARFRGRDRFPS